MKITKMFLFVLAGAWVVLIGMEKMAGTAGKLHTRGKFFPVRWGYGLARLAKSLLLVSLALSNLFMVLSLIDRKPRI